MIDLNLLLWKELGWLSSTAIFLHLSSGLSTRTISCSLELDFEEEASTQHEIEKNLFLLVLISLEKMKECSCSVFK